MQDPDRTASLMTPAKLAQVKPKAPPSPAAWLDQMALDAGHAHVRRIADLQEDLRSQGQGQACSSLVSGELGRLAQELPRLDFGLLQSRGGWWARVRGKDSGSGGEFVAQFQRIEQAVEALVAKSQLLRKQQLELAGTDRALLELDVESRALDQIIDQGTRWLHDMRGQLKARQAGDAAVQRQTEEDTARCELLVERLKVLRAIASGAQQTRQQAQGAAARRSAFVKMLQHALDKDIRAWRDDVSAVAGVDGSSPGQDLEASMASHRDLQLCIKQAVADCAQLHSDEQALAQQLAALGGHLHAAS